MLEIARYTKSNISNFPRYTKSNISLYQIKQSPLYQIKHFEFLNKNWWFRLWSSVEDDTWWESDKEKGAEEAENREAQGGAGRWSSQSGGGATMGATVVGCRLPLAVVALVVLSLGGTSQPSAHAAGLRVARRQAVRPAAIPSPREWLAAQGAEGVRLASPVLLRAFFCFVLSAVYGGVCVCARLSRRAPAPRPRCLIPCAWLRVNVTQVWRLFEEAKRHTSAP
jgi:hypothetical protein